MTANQFLIIHEDGAQIPISKKNNFYSKFELMDFMRQGDLFNNDGEPASESDINQFLSP